MLDYETDSDTHFKCPQCGQRGSVAKLALEKALSETPHVYISCSSCSNRFEPFSDMEVESETDLAAPETPSIEANAALKSLARHWELDAAATSTIEVADNDDQSSLPYWMMPSRPTAPAQDIQDSGTDVAAELGSDTEVEDNSETASEPEPIKKDNPEGIEENVDEKEVSEVEDQAATETGRDSGDRQQMLYDEAIHEPRNKIVKAEDQFASVNPTLVESETESEVVAEAHSEISDGSVVDYEEFNKQEEPATVSVGNLIGFPDEITGPQKNLVAEQDSPVHANTYNVENNDNASERRKNLLIEYADENNTSLIAKRIKLSVMDGGLKNLVTITLLLLVVMLTGLNSCMLLRDAPDVRTYFSASAVASADISLQGADFNLLSEASGNTVEIEVRFINKGEKTGTIGDFRIDLQNAASETLVSWTVLSSGETVQAGDARTITSVLYGPPEDLTQVSIAYPLPN